MPGEYQEMLDKLIQEENERRWWNSNPSDYKPVTFEEIPRLIEEQKLRDMYEDERGR